MRQTPAARRRYARDQLAQMERAMLVPVSGSETLSGLRERHRIDTRAAILAACDPELTAAVTTALDRLARIAAEDARHADDGLFQAIRAVYYYQRKLGELCGFVNEGVLDEPMQAAILAACDRWYTEQRKETACFQPTSWGGGAY